jgi:hypothetical protein
MSKFDFFMWAVVGVLFAGLIGFVYFALLSLNFGG